MSKTVLITGGAGFLGSHTADALSAKGYSIRIVDNLQGEVHAGKWPRYIQRKGYELIRADVREKSVWEKALKGVEAVFHLAAYQDQRPDFSRFYTTNTVSTALMYEVIAEKNLPVRSVVYASSQFVYGDGAYQDSAGRTFFPELRREADLKAGRWAVRAPDGGEAVFTPFREDQPVQPTNSYGLSKFASEMMALRLGKTYGIPTKIMRYSIIQGPRQSPRNLYSGALRIFISQALAGVPITVYEDGRQLRDFVNVHDVVAANLLVMKSRKADFQVFNVSGGRAVPVVEFAEAVKSITGSASPIVLGGYRHTDTRNAVSDSSKLQALGWKPKAGITDSIRTYVEWYMAEGFHKTAPVEQLKALKAGIRK